MGSETKPGPKSTSPMQDWRIWLLVAALGVILIFILSNMRNDVDINFLWLDWSIPLIFVLLFSAALGGMIAFLMMTMRLNYRREKAGPGEP